ncbi:succinylglutamate desuccinylase/aspartoacylase family protein [Ekhidna sp. To15]|uniref:succinylglutamate desuccinylase/aspartoacylase family protein n=1 Tax=Ekhidna sp. To15 TaxID=3395267 RepID=UPI003F5217A1
MMREPITIRNQQIKPGKIKQINISLSRLPTRTHVEIPIIVSHSKEPGPVLLLMGGMHGDEINGAEIVRRILANKYHIVDKGTVICIPILNVYGFLNFSRQVPDGKDVNRSFPGSKSGSLASQIAYYVRREILPLIDCGLDFHTGGSRINNYPQIRGQLDSNFGLELAKAFAPKYLINSKLREKSLRKEAAKNGKHILVYEGGESLRLRKHAIDQGVNGALRVMHHLGMIGTSPPKKFDPILISSSTWLRTPAAGLYYSLVRPGDKVTVGQELAYVNGPYGDFEKLIKSKYDGHVIAVNNIPVVNKGDALMHIGMTNK